MHPMEEIRSLQDIEAALAKITVQTTKDMLVAMTLDGALNLAKAAGSPHERLKVVHVAGTSGKTSTSYMISQLLRRAGKTAGLVVSPHVVDMRERVQLGDEFMSEDEFVQYFVEFRALTRDIDFVPTRFEYMMVFAFWVFDKAGMEYAVVETGLGGRLDASNICRRSDKLCVITDIGLDHVQILGTTLRDITREKAGIIAPENTVVAYEQSSEVMTVLRDVAAANDAVLVEVQPRPEDLFMERNAWLSYKAYEVIAGRDGLPAFDDTVAEEVAHLAVPGRLQSIRYKEKQVILDGAHNQQKMQALARALKAHYPEVRWSAVYAMKADKDFKPVVAEIAPLLERVIVVPLKPGSDMPIESAALEELSAEFSRHNVPVMSASSGKEALDRLVDRSDTPILVTGSLYLVSEIL